MPIFRCTERLRRAMSLTPRDLTVPTAAPSIAAEWYCNLLHLDRRKCLLFTHPQTLFSFLVPAVKKADLDRFGEMFRKHLADALAGEGLDARTCLRPLANGQDAFAKATGTKNKELFKIEGATHIETYWVPKYVEAAMGQLTPFYARTL